MIIASPDLLGPMLKDSSSTAALAELHLIWREAMDLKSRLVVATIEVADFIIGELLSSVTCECDFECCTIHLTGLS